MNASLANLILSRITDADLPWVEKTAGLTRAISFSKGAAQGVFPIACNVTDPQSCTSETVSELLPLESYRSLLFFEGNAFPERINDPALGIAFRSKLRVVVWLNCSLLGGDCNCGDQAAQNLISAIEHNRKYNATPFLNVKHKVVGGITRGKDVFAQYTFDEKRSQYLHYPFDFFALDIQTDFRVVPGCEEELSASGVGCWTPPTDGMRRHPKNFTCEELQDPDSGLTSEQLGEDCLNCGDGGDACPFDVVVNVNGTAVANVTDLDPCVDNTINIV